MFSSEKRVFLMPTEFKSSFLSDEIFFQHGRSLNENVGKFLTSIYFGIVEKYFSYYASNQKLYNKIFFNFIIFYQVALLQRFTVKHRFNLLNNF